MSTMGQRIRALRKAGGFTLQDIATRFGVHRSSIHDWEYGRTHPDMKRMGDVAAFLNTSVEYLVTGRDPWPLPDVERQRILKLSPDRLRELSLTLSTALTILESRDEELTKQREGKA